MKKLLITLPLLLIMFVGCQNQEAPKPVNNSSTTNQHNTTTPTPNPVDTCINCAKVVRRIRETTSICPRREIQGHRCNLPGTRACQRQNVWYVRMELKCGNKWAVINGKYNDDFLERYVLGDTYCSDKPIIWKFSYQ